MTDTFTNTTIPSMTLDTATLDELIAVYQRELDVVLDDVAPEKTCIIPVRSESDWYTSEIRDAKQIRRRFERKWRNSGLEVHRQMFKEQCCKVNVMIGTGKANYYKKLVDDHKGDTKNLFKVVNSLLGKKSKSTLPSSTDKDIAKLFSDYFVDKIITIRDSIQPDQSDIKIPSLDISPSQLCTFEQVTQIQVDKIIKASASKSCHLDPLPTQLLKMVLPKLLPLITAIMNKSLENGIFPSSYKLALVCPLLKNQKLDPEICKSYRPVSNLAFLSKVLEKVVASQLNDHLSSNKLHDPYQSAYRSGHSTETVLLSLHNDVIKAIGEQKVVLLVMLDLSAAFDTVSHECLLSTLSELGISGVVLQWFQSYLSGRQQKINIKGTHSDVKELSCGVPQGSVLGPVLFNIYTSSLGRMLRQNNSDYYMYADDSSIYLSVRPDQIDTATGEIAQCVSLIQKWMCKFHLKMNEDKTEFLVVSSKQMAKRISPSPLIIGNTPILPSPSVRNLGVIIDKFASMEDYISSICRGAYLQLKNISRLKKYLDTPTLECIVHAFVTSKLDYCNSLLIGLPDTLISRLQCVQNTAARILTGTPKYAHITPVLKELHWLPIEKRVIYKILLMVFKAVRRHAPEYLQNIIVEYVPTRSLRSASQKRLEVPYTPSTLVQDRAFSVVGPQLWNDLPFYIRNEQSILVFKSKLKTHLFRATYR